MLMTERYYENFWDCPKCGTKDISSLRKMKCPNCGGSKVTQDEENNKMVEITDDYGLKLAKSGMNWSCSYCGNVNLDSDKKCQGCHADRGDEVKGVFKREEITDHIKEYDITHGEGIKPGEFDVIKFSTKKNREEQDYYPGGEKLHNDEPKVAFKTSREYFKEKRKEYQKEEDAKASYHMNRIKESTKKHAIPLTILMVVLGVIAAVYFTSVGYPGVITGLYWERTYNIERYQTVRDSGWSTEYGAFNVRSYSKIHHYDDIYETRSVTEQVPHTVTTYQTRTRYFKNGNGSTTSTSERVPVHRTEYRTETRMKSVRVGERPIYRTYYEYDINRWIYSHSLHSRGTDKNLVWPKFEPDKGNVSSGIGATRVGSSKQDLKVHVEWFKKEKERKLFPVGTYDNIMVNDKVLVNYILGMPTSITLQPKGESN